jgi:hypothetical protein
MIIEKAEATIVKSEVSLHEVIGVYLKYTPSYAETEQLRTDLRTMNHTLLRDAILECTKTNKVPDGALKGQKRKAFHEIYTRKVKELAALYPMLFSVENALRSYASDAYSQKFATGFWWRHFLPTDPNDTATHKTEANFQLGGKNSQNKYVGAVSVNPAFISHVLYCVNKSMTRDQLAHLIGQNAAPEDFYRHLTFSGITGLFLSDFTLCPLGTLKKQDFNGHARSLRIARNELFHGNPIKDRKVVYTACERVLDSLNIHLGDFDEALKCTSYSRFRSNITRTDRHCLPPV